jgi:hypothetical protein
MQKRPACRGFIRIQINKWPTARQELHTMDFDDRLELGLSPSAAVAAFEAACNRNADRLFITESWFAPFRARLLSTLPSALDSCLIDALRDALYKRRSLETVVQFVERQPMTWEQFAEWQTEQDRQRLLGRARDGYSPLDPLDSRWNPDSIDSRSVDSRTRLDPGAERFLAILETAQGEGDVQRYLEQHPAVILSTVHSTVPLLLSKVRLGADFIPDLAFYSRDYKYDLLHLVELETPSLELFTGADSFSAAFTHAIQQLEDWGSWCRRHHAFLHQVHAAVPFDQCLPEGAQEGILDPLRVTLHLYAGRRRQFTNDRRLGRWRERVFNLPKNMFIHTYDGLAALVRPSCGFRPLHAAATFRYSRQQFFRMDGVLGDSETTG